ncbi:MAG TPA: type IV pilus assembly protein PilM, partial [Acidimicrobiia bacterium]|nr:type IV pilus assembly protein PilM [Acidimicrobiia bacterium]
MAERMLGLDVATSAVRVVEVVFDRPGGRNRSGRGPTVSRVGEVPLPVGAVRDGEVADPAAVGAAIAELWRQTGLRSRDVRVGLTGSRVVVRVIDMPAMPDEDMAGAIRFSAADHIPIPLDEAVLDHAVLEPAPSAEAGGAAMVRVLVVAAHRSTLDGLMAAVAAGGVRAVAVDLVPFALVRALHEPPTAAEELPGTDDGLIPPPPPAAEAIVSVGAALTTVVVHEAGRPRFVRTVQAGGDMLTAAIADELGVGPDAAEIAKRDAGDARAARVVELRLSGILGEVQSGLAYWMAQSERPLRRIVLTGGGARAGDIAGRLALLVGAPVEWRTVRGLDAPDSAAGPGDWADHTVAAGLALGAHAEGWQIDLCPPAKRSFRLTGEMGRRLAVAAAVVVVLGGGLSVRSVLALRAERRALAAQQQATARVQAEIGQFADLKKLSTDLDTSRRRLQSALAGDVSWTRFLDDFVRHMPPGAWLGSLSAQVNTGPAGGAKASAAAAAPAATTAAAPAPATSAATGTPSAGTPAAGIGSVQVAVTGLDFPDAADWLRKIAVNPSLAGV